MGRLIVPPAGLTYVDTNTVISRVERVEPYWSTSSPLWDALDREACRLATSELTWLEVLVKPLREGNAGLVALFESILFGSGMRCRPIELSILERAASLRASQRLNTADSIHAATAMNLSPGTFVTNDVAFRRVTDLNTVILDELVST